ncbi:DMSO/selenate family reductase complex B subunit [Devriesea agamarum]|uniref:DMSO/selenate family reductase complex B subunit n=1 Tax=Devriesea agamarum TaxID=472569 RepID=UPI00071C9A5E|nr:DMSO/selenate family reductase complex B subunit [Devriesea agamarum]
MGYRQLAFFVNQAACTGCSACQMACKDKHDLPEGVNWRRVREYTAGSTTQRADATFNQDVTTVYTSISCNHCDDPICVKVCPTTAMHKGEDGIVSVDPNVCIGCRYCEMACPYSAPQFNPEAGVMSKCNFCADYIAAGKTPACVAACPSRALDYGEAEDLRRKYGREAGVEPLPSPSITHPNLVVHPHPDAQPSGRGTGHIANEHRG